MKSLLRLKPYLRPYLGSIIASTILAIPLAAIRGAPVWLLKHFIDDLGSPTGRERLRYYPAVIIGLYLLNFIIRFPHYYLLRTVVIKVNEKLKSDLFDHLLGLTADYFTVQSTGSLISRVGSDTAIIDGGISAINVMVREPISFIVFFGYALKLNWRLTLITILIFPPLAWVLGASGKNLKRYIHKMNLENANLFSTLQESFVGIRVIKTFRLEKYVKAKFEKSNENFGKTHTKTAILEEASHPAVELLYAFVMALVIYYGGHQVLTGKMTTGDLMGFFASVALMMTPIRAINEVNIKLNQAAGACERVFEIFDWQPRFKEDSNPTPLTGFKSSIRLSGIGFAYPDTPQRQVLKNISFEVPHGSVIALVGASGSGKSSLVSLIPRIFDVTSGKIEIDGIDIRRYKISDLRGKIAVVSQDVFLFNDTIRENIRCGRENATEAEIREAARRAHALDFIESIPGGFDAVIGDRGQKLSGGERQRVSIARAFLREAPILILDEATSSLDSASERAVQAALEELMVNRTTLVIAHRLSTIRNANEILVMKDGEILERGDHGSLISGGGEYARLHNLA
jgi:subfamily B ATP-binding cassette protein MsbA